MSQLTEEISRRRTFAIISHPDAGKTTLTEKFLLYGGAIAQAGVVKGKKNSRAATSDWMEIEKQRGISVTSSVMQFQYNGFCINILDTPGHQDFSEDTYRTLMAADSAVMVIDGAQGRGAPDPEAVQGLRHAPHPHFHLRQQDGPGGQGPLRSSGRGGAGAGHRDLRHELAHRLRQGFSGRLRPGEGRAAVLLRRLREEAGGQTGNRSVRPAGCPAAGQRGKAPAAHRRCRASVRRTGNGYAGRPGRAAVACVLRLRADQLRRGAVSGSVPEADAAALSPAPPTAA